MFFITISSPLWGKISGTCPFLKRGVSPDAAWNGIGPCTTVIGQAFFCRTTEHAGTRQTRKGFGQHNGITKAKVELCSPSRVHARKRLVSPFSSLMADSPMQSVALMTADGALEDTTDSLEETRPN